MSVASMNPEDLSGSHVKIGAPSHAGRNLGFLVGALLLGGGIFGYYRYSEGQDASRVAQLESFRALYAEKCDAPAWRGEAPALVRETYLNSSRLQSAIDGQLTALRAGTPCEEVLKSLKSADFPLPQAPKPEATN